MFGNLPNTLGLTKSNLMEAAKLGAGAAAFPFAYGVVQGQLLLKASPTTFAQNTPAEMGVRAISGVILGALVNKMGGAKLRSVGDGVMASAVGSVFKDIVSSWMNPAAQAAQAATQAAEQATGQSQMSGVNPLGRGLAGLGALPAGQFPLGGATVAVEEVHAGGLHGATVAINEGNFAAALG
ncbi:MAG: hypothetical protein KGI71_05105 [Patescibacteria group bacterium]|nr:hypothetical protein [Patescibacteria group bacterium]